MKSIVILLWQVGLILMIRSELCEDIVIITHKRVFRHKSKREIPFFRRLLLLNYINIFKKKWMWHYICFILEIPFSILTVIFSILKISLQRHNHKSQQKPSQPTLKRRCFFVKSDAFLWPGFGKEWC